jgi:acetylornithine deacetylase
MRMPWIISDNCTIEYTLWYLPNEDPEEVKKEVETYIQKASALDSWLTKHPPKVEWKNDWPPYEIPVDHLLTKTLCKAYDDATEKEHKLAGYTPNCDATFLNEAGIPSLVFGPGDVTTAHSSREACSIDELMAATKTYALAIMDWCS